jgi:hypothetical protein
LWSLSLLKTPIRYAKRTRSFDNVLFVDLMCVKLRVLAGNATALLQLQLFPQQGRSIFDLSLSSVFGTKTEARPVLVTQRRAS